MLTNFVIFVTEDKDKLLRLIVGLLVAFLGLTLQFLTQPFRKDAGILVGL